jgi:DNA-binding MarR family transcriptional regulator
VPSPRTDPPRTDPPDAGTLALAATFERFHGLLRRLVPPSDLSLTSVSTLHRLDGSGPHRLSDLAVLEGVTQPAMTQVVTRLERDSLATRGTDPTDGRVVLVAITDAGRERLARRRLARSRRLADLMAGLSAEDRALITAALPALDRLAERLPPNQAGLPPSQAGLPPNQLGLPPDQAGLRPDEPGLPSDEPGLPPDQAGGQA